MTLSMVKISTRPASGGGAFIELDHTRATAGYLNPLLAPLAEGIVRAVNNHEALVEALQGMCDEQRHPSRAYEIARKLLASLE